MSTAWSLDDVFNEEYLLCYEPVLTDEITSRQADLTSRLLHAEPGGRLIDICCGHGRYTRHLASQGYRIVGVDLSETFLEIAARSSAQSAHFVRADARTLPFQNGLAAGAFCLFTSIGYSMPADDQKLFVEIHRVLRPGTRFLLETNSWNNIRTMTTETESTMTSPSGRMVDRVRYSASENRSYNIRTYELADREPRTVTFSVYLYRPEELVEMLRTAGFGKIDVRDGSGEPFTSDSRRMTILAEKR